MNNLVILHATSSELGQALEGCAEKIDIDAHEGIVYGVSREGRVVGARSSGSGPPVVDADIPYGVRCLTIPHKLFRMDKTPPPDRNPESTRPSET